MYDTLCWWRSLVCFGPDSAPSPAAKACSREWSSACTRSLDATATNASPQRGPRRTGPVSSKRATRGSTSTPSLRPGWVSILWHVPLRLCVCPCNTVQFHTVLCTGSVSIQYGSWAKSLILMFMLFCVGLYCLYTIQTFVICKPCLLAPCCFLHSVSLSTACITITARCTVSIAGPRKWVWMALPHYLHLPRIH